jgi:hypothetical protein
MGLRGVDHIIVADQEIRVPLIEPAILVVDPVHAEEYGLSNVTRRTQFGKQIVEMFLIGLSWFVDVELVLP